MSSCSSIRSSTTGGHWTRSSPDGPSPSSPRCPDTSASTHREMNDPSVWPPCLAPVSETPRPGIRGGGGGGVFGLFVGALTLTQEYRSLRRRGRGFRQRAPPLRLAAHRRASRESAC